MGNPSLQATLQELHRGGSPYLELRSIKQPLKSLPEDLTGGSAETQEAELSGTDAAPNLHCSESIMTRNPTAQAHLAKHLSRKDKDNLDCSAHLVPQIYQIELICLEICRRDDRGNTQKARC